MNINVHLSFMSKSENSTDKADTQSTKFAPNLSDTNVGWCVAGDQTTDTWAVALLIVNKEDVK